MKNITIIFLLIFLPFINFAQVGIGTTNPDDSSILDIASDSKGLLIPRATTLQRNAIVNPAEGLILFNLTTSNFNYFDTIWKDFSPSYKSINSIVDISTNSTIDVDVPGMELMPSEGTYSVSFDSQISNTSVVPPVLVDSNMLLTDYYLLYNQLQNHVTNYAVHTAGFGEGETILAGKYAISSAVSVTGSLILDGGNDPNSVFIISASGAINFSANTIIVLTNGASAENVFWVAEGAIGIGASSLINGSLVSHNGAVAVGALCTINGRMITNSGAVSFGPGNCNVPTNASALINLGTLNTFVVFTGVGAISNTGNSIYNGNICSGLGLTDSLLSATVNGVIVAPNTYVQVNNGVNTNATFSIYQNNVLIQSSRKQITCNSNYTNLSLSAIATVLNGETITVKWKIDSGTLTLGNRVLTSIKVQ
jgi:Ice-binding-like